MFCDSKSVVQLLNQPFANSHVINRLFKWLNCVRLFNLRILHIKGEDNVIADALTRMHQPNSEPSHLSSLISEIKAFESSILHVNAISINSDTPQYKGFTFDAIKQYLQTLQIPQQYLDRAKSFINCAHEFVIDDGSLFKLASKGHLMRKVITDPKEIQKIFATVHDNRGHLKLATACHYINTQFYIYNLWSLLKEYIKTCDTCQKFDSLPNQQPPLFSTEPGALFSTICVDCIHMPTTGLNDKYIIIARDKFSSWPEAISVPNISGAIVAKFLYESFITRYGYFTSLKTDGGPEFCNQVISTLVETYGIKHILGTPHYPQSHGFIERASIIGDTHVIF